MGHKAIYLAVALSFMIILTPRVMSPGTDESRRTWETPKQRAIGRSYKAIGPALQNEHPTPGENTHSAGLKAPRKDLSELEEAERFMQLKAAVYADLNRLEESRHAKPKRDTVRNADANRQKTGNGAVNRASVGPIRKSSVQATSAVQPVSLESAAGTPSYKRMP